MKSDECGTYFSPARTIFPDLNEFLVESFSLGIDVFAAELGGVHSDVGLERHVLPFYLVLGIVNVEEEHHAREKEE